jgi:hypothetical protein
MNELWIWILWFFGIPAGVVLIGFAWVSLKLPGYQFIAQYSPDQD